MEGCGQFSAEEGSGLRARGRVGGPWDRRNPVTQCGSVTASSSLAGRGRAGSLIPVLDVIVIAVGLVAEAGPCPVTLGKLLFSLGLSFSFPDH